MDTLRQDLRFALRALRSRPGFTAIAVMTLALGIGATTSIFSVVRGILLRPLPYADSDRLVMVWETTVGSDPAPTGGQNSHPNYLDIKAGIGGLESIAQASSSNFTVTEAGGAELVRGGRVTTDFFRVFRAPPVTGREFTSDEDRLGGPNVAVVSEGYWRERLGGRADVIGSTLRIGGTDHEIVGVAPAGFDYPSGARIWVPAQNDDEGCGRGCVFRHSVGRLAEGASLERVRAELTPLAQRLEAEYPESNTNVTFTAALLRDVVVGDVRPALWILLAAVAMVLLIACANVANLLLVRGQARATEIAVRSTLGADRGRILAQLLTESLLLAIVGGVAGAMLAAWGVDALRSFAPMNIPRIEEVRLDVLTIGFAGMLAVVTSLLFGLAPAIHLSRAELAESLRRGGRADVNAGRTGIGRSAILVSEVALSVILLTAAGLMVRSLVRMNDVKPGFDPAGVTHFRLSLPDARYGDPAAAVRFMDELRERLQAVPGVEQVAVMAAPPLGNASLFGSFVRPDQPEPAPGREPSASYRVADEFALELLRIPIVAGRGFEAGDRHGGQPVVLISESTARRYFAGEDPVGRPMQVQVSVGYPEEEPRTVVGVFGDIRGTELTQEAEPEMIVPYAQAGAQFPDVLIRARIETAQVLEAARRELQALDPELPMIRPGTMDEWVARQTAQSRFYLLLLGLFALLAVVLAAVGIYGVVAFAVSQRTREIGVRVALGARIDQVVSLVLWQGLRPSLYGILIGVLGAFWGGRMIRGLLYDVVPQDPVTFAAVPLLLAAVVVAACALPARRATRIPPATALRNE